MATKKQFSLSMLSDDLFSSKNIIRFLDDVALVTTPTDRPVSNFTSSGSSSSGKVKKFILTERNFTTETSAIDNEDSEEAVEFRKGLEYFLDNDVVDLGNENSTDFHVKSWLRKNPVMVQIQFGKVAAASQDSPRRLTGMLSVLSHLDKKDMHPMSTLFVQSCLSFVWTDVKEYAIGVLEHWGDSALIISSLKYREVAPKWLDEYRKQVVSDHEGG